MDEQIRGIAEEKAILKLESKLSIIEQELIDIKNKAKGGTAQI